MQVVARFAGDGNGSRLGRMLELTMTAALTNESPTIIAKQSQDFTDFHVTATTV